MAAAANAVVLGRITGVMEGRVFGTPEYPVYAPQAIVAVTRLLAGEIPDDEASLILEFATLERPNVASLSDLLVGTDALFFLRNKGVQAQLNGLASQVQQRERRFHRVVNSLGMMIQGADGIILPLSWEEASAIRSQVDGKSIDDIVELVEAP
jgi:hypothetical protein